MEQILLVVPFQKLGIGQTAEISIALSIGSVALCNQPLYQSLHFFLEYHEERHKVMTFLAIIGCKSFQKCNPHFQFSVNFYKIGNLQIDSSQNLQFCFIVGIVFIFRLVALFCSSCILFGCFLAQGTFFERTFTGFSIFLFLLNQFHNILP